MTPLILIGLLLALAIDFAFRPRLLDWQWMWLVSATMFAGLKLLTIARLSASERYRLSPRRLAEYLLLWPGMRPQPFFVGTRRRHLPIGPLVWRGIANLLLGTVLLWLVPAAWLPALPRWAQAWLGLVGIALLLHFGFFDLLAAGWRRAGVAVDPIFDRPTHAGSLADFWGRRWNRAFSDFARDLILKPLSRRMSSRAAGFVVFLFSGLAHDLAISVPARGGYGLPTLYFLLQGMLVLGEGTRPVRSMFRHRPWLGHVWAWIGVLAPAPLLFHVPFLERVVLPFLAAIGASSANGGLP